MVAEPCENSAPELPMCVCVKKDKIKTKMKRDERPAQRIKALAAKLDSLSLIPGDSYDR